jgi:hypothetical protein
MKQAYLTILSLLLVVPLFMVEAASGGLTGYLSISSVNNMMGTFVPLIAYYAINNKTFPVNLHKVGLGYTLDLKDVHIDTISGFTTKSIEFINGTDLVKVVLSDIQVNSIIDGTVYALWFIPLRASTCNITGFDLTVTLGINPDVGEKTQYTIVEATVITVGDVELKTDSSVLNYLLKITHGTI